MATHPSCYSGVIDYQTLASCSIRLIHIDAKRRDSNEPLQAQMISVCLDAIEQRSSPYLALSYVWSSEQRDFPIILNGKPIKITKTLGEVFLDNWSHMPEGSSENWWVDQLCINQDDDQDKAQQIPRMREIYEKARTIVAYIRPSFEDAHLGMDLMHRLAVLSHGQPASRRLLDHLPMSEILGPATEENIRAWHALKNLYSHKYWTRTWIMPEATAQLDNCLVFCAGLDYGMPLRRIFLVGDMHKRLHSRDFPPEFVPTQAPSALVARVETFAILRTTPEEHHRCLLELLSITRRTECTRPEDKVYAMLPFAADVGDYVDDRYLKPSYTLGCARIYSDVIKWYVVKYRNLDFLGYCTATKYETAQIPGFDLPSWIPNWTHASYMKPFRKFSDPSRPDEDQNPLYKACGPFSRSINVVEPPSPDFMADKLFISGLQIATVHKVLKPALDGGYWQPEIEFSWQDEFDADAEYPLTGECYRDAFERTTVADVTTNHDDGTTSRPGKVKWWQDRTDVDREESGRWELQMRIATGDRRLFFARSNPVPVPPEDAHRDETGNTAETGSSPQLGTDCTSFLMGLGRSDIAVGDEIWALKGGQVLYVLRRNHKTSMLTVQNMADAPEPGWPSCPSMLWLNGKAYPWKQKLEGPSYSFVGECYVHGLMDGEALEFAKQRPEEGRPEVLSEMASEFREIFVGGMLSWERVVDKSEKDLDLVESFGEVERMVEEGESKEFDRRWVENHRVF